MKGKYFSQNSQVYKKVFFVSLQYFHVLSFIGFMPQRHFDFRSSRIDHSKAEPENWSQPCKNVVIKRDQISP